MDVLLLADVGASEKSVADAIRALRTLLPGLSAGKLCFQVSWWGGNCLLMGGGVLPESVVLNCTECPSREFSTFRFSVIVMCYVNNVTCFCLPFDAIYDAFNSTLITFPVRTSNLLIGRN